MAYEHFFQYYDTLMSDVNYNLYIQLVKKYAKADFLVLDLACGTGNVLIKLLESGLNVHGLDLSEEMLLITENKLLEKKLVTNLYQDDMRHMNVYSEYDMIISFLDSINYLTSKKDVLMTFKKVYQALNKDGYFIFDIHSVYKATHVFDGYSYNEIDESLTYLWNTFVEQEDDFYRVFHQLCFFIPKANSLYQRLEEIHEQTVFNLSFYLDTLKQVGFSIEAIYYDFDDNKTEDNCDKIYIVSKKC